MHKRISFTLFLLALTAILLIATACSTTTGGGEEAGQEAFVDDVSVAEREDHSYAAVFGHYPDACSRISSVQQSVEGSEITIMLYVDRPADMMCAQMLTPYNVDILLETGGLAPGEYSVSVNNHQPAAFTVK